MILNDYYRLYFLYLSFQDSLGSLIVLIIYSKELYASTYFGAYPQATNGIDEVVADESNIKSHNAIESFHTKDLSETSLSGKPGTHSPIIDDKTELEKYFLSNLNQSVKSTKENRKYHTFDNISSTVKHRKKNYYKYILPLQPSELKNYEKSSYPITYNNFISSGNTINTQKIVAYLPPKQENNISITDILAPTLQDQTDKYHLLPIDSKNESEPNLTLQSEENLRHKFNTYGSKQFNPNNLLLSVTIKEETADQLNSAKSSIDEMKEIAPELAEDLLTKKEQALYPPLKVENDLYQVGSMHVEDITHENTKSLLLPITTKNESEPSHLINCIKKLQNSGYLPTVSSNIENVLPVHKLNPLPPVSGIKTPTAAFHEPLPPLPNPMKPEIHEILVPVKEFPDKLFPFNVSPDSVQDTLPPIQSFDEKGQAEEALPIIGTYPAAVVHSGPYPAAVSILKEIPVAQMAELLPPLHNGAFKNVNSPKTSELDTTNEGPYAINKPMLSE